MNGTAGVESRDLRSATGVLKLAGPAASVGPERWPTAADNRTESLTVKSNIGFGSAGISLWLDAFEFTGCEKLVTNTSSSHSNDRTGCDCITPLVTSSCVSLFWGVSGQYGRGFNIGEL